MPSHPDRVRKNYPNKWWRSLEDCQENSGFRNPEPAGRVGPTLTKPTGSGKLSSSTKNRKARRNAKQK